MIVRKSAAELEKMRRAGRITAQAREAVLEAVRPGITTAELDEIAEKVIRGEGAAPSFKGYRGFTGSICASVNHEIVHGIPGERALEDGDLFKVDVGAIWEGFHGDSAMTVFVGSPPSEEAARLVEVTRAALEAAIERIRPGNRVGDVGHAVQTLAEREGFSVVREYVGHGIGRALHEEPHVPNYGQPGRGHELKPGLVIAVEPMINAGGWETELLDDGWTVVTADGSLSAHFEHTIAVTEDGPEVLTR